MSRPSMCQSPAPLWRREGLNTALAIASQYGSYLPILEFRESADACVGPRSGVAFSAGALYRRFREKA